MTRSRRVGKGALPNSSPATRAQCSAVPTRDYVTACRRVGTARNSGPVRHIHFALRAFAHPTRSARCWLAAFLLALSIAPSFAQEAYPSRLVKIILPSAPGSTTDMLARLIADQLAQKWGKPVIVENISGGGMSIGATQAFRAAPDGYTLFICPPSPVTIMKLLYRDLPFEPTQFTPISLLVRVPNALVVRKDFPATDIKGLIAHAKANPGKVTFASQGAGSTAHLSANLIDLLAGTEMVHVPYRGAVPALNAIVAGQIDFFFDTVTTSTPQHRAGNVKIIGVGGTERSPVVPEAPPVSPTACRASAR